jgi:hypothetical protein
MGWWFGRIMTFEVIADEERPAIGTILSDASTGLIGTTDATEVVGYAAYGQTIGATVEPLIECYAIDLFDDGARLSSPPVAEALVIDEDELGSSADERGVARIQREQSPARSLPSVLRLGYYEPALDYQSGEARATSGDRLGVEERRDLPAAIDAGEAKTLAQAVIARAWARRDRLTLRLPPRYAGLQPGARVQLDLSGGRWRVEQCTLDAFVVVVELVPSEGGLPKLTADAGRIAPSKDVVTADVVLALLDVPDVLGRQSNTPTLLLGASAPSEGWRSYNSQIAVGEQTIQAVVARRKSVLGRALSVLGSGDPYLINEAGSFDVELIDADQWLMSCDEDGLFSGRNLAVLGREVLQFGSAEPLGDGRFRLTRLLRGRAGTEWAIAGHSADEVFVIVEPDALRAVDLDSWSVGASASASVRNVSGSTSSSPPVDIAAESLRPLSPVGLRADRDSDGNLAVNWTRRSRRGFAWVDGIDAPLGESLERYRLSIGKDGGTIELETDAPVAVLGAAEVGALGSGPATIEVRQIGDAAASRPAQISINI